MVHSLLSQRMIPRNKIVKVTIDIYHHDSIYHSHTIIRKNVNYVYLNTCESRGGRYLEDGSNETFGLANCKRPTHPQSASKYPGT